MILDIMTPAEKLASLTWPQMETVRHVSLAPDDWLVICAGFEDRALAILDSAVRSEVPFRVLLILYRPFLAENRADLIRQACERAGITPVEVTCDRQDLTGFGSVVVGQMTPTRGRIFIDVSGMSRLLIVQILGTIGARPQGFRDCFVLYAEAQSYPPSREEAEAELARSESDPTLSILFLSSGVFEVTVLPELSSLGIAGAQTRLVVFPSLDAHHLIALRVELQPSRFSFIEGVPPTPENRWRQKFIAGVNRLDQIRGAEVCKASTLRYQETLECLLEIYRAHAVRERLLIAPTGSKMQTVAVGIFRSFVHDSQIVYPTPSGFRSPEKYTCGIGPLHLLPLEAFARGGIGLAP